MIARRLNYRVIMLGPDTGGQTIGVRRRGGEYRYLRWLGFIDRSAAKQIPGAKPVKLEAHRITSESAFSSTWRDMVAGEHIQGYLVAGGVYAVLEGDCPRVLPAEPSF